MGASLKKIGVSPKPERLQAYGCIEIFRPRTFINAEESFSLLNRSDSSGS